MNKNKFKKGLTIEYVMVTMTIVVAFIVLIFATLMLDSTNSGLYNKYLDKKEFLDTVGSEFIYNVQNGIKDVNLSEKYQNNDFGCVILAENNILKISNINEVVLYVNMQRDAQTNEMIVTTYKYGV